MGNLPKLPSSYTFLGLAYDISTTAVYQNGTADDVQVCFNLPSLTGVSNLQILHLEGNAWVSRTATGGSAANLCTDNLTSLSPFVIAQGLAPTAANVSVAGKINNASGRGIRNVFVTITDTQGNSRTVSTSSFGNYRFDEINAGEIYVISVQTKRFRFNPSSQVLNVTNSLEEVNFTALPN